MELRHLRYFLAVAHEGNFTRAAAKLRMQQPPLSTQIRDLERELGYALFRRLPRGVELTEGGAVFRREAEAILEAVERGVKRAGQAAHGLAGSLALGFTSSAMTHRLVPDLIRAFREANPGVELEFHEGNANLISEGVAAGTFDAGFIRRPVSKPLGVAFHTLTEERMLLLLPVSHPVARKALASRSPDRVRLADLADEPFIFVRRPGAPGMYGDLLDACRKLGFTPKVAAEVQQMLTNITMVAAGMGVSAVPESMKPIHAESVLYAEAADAPRLRAPLTLLTRAEPTPVAARFLHFALGRRPAARGAASAPSPRRSSPGS
jgi:DNA-binding transcriptional LysR family regulator